MSFEKKIPGYVVAAVFALSGILYLGAYAHALFANVAAARIPLMLVVTLLAVALGALISFLCLYFNGKTKKSVAEEMTDKIKWQKIFYIAAIAIGVLGFLFRIVRIVAASDLSENAIYRAALNGAYSDDSSGGIRVQLFITILSAMIKPFGAGLKTTLVMQTILYCIAVVFVFFALWFLSGRLSAVIAAAGMLFLPVFPDSVTPSDAVMFWLMFGAGLLVGAVFLRYAKAPDDEYPLYMKLMISVFTGLLVGIIIGWDAGLLFLLLPVVYVFFAGEAKPVKMLPLAGAFLGATVAGFFVSVASLSTWAKYYFSDVTARLPVVKESYTLLIFLVAALSLLGIAVFFCIKKHDNVTYLMLFAIFAMWIASQMTLSGVYAAGFPVLLFLALFGAGVEGLLSPESREILKTAGAKVKGGANAKKAKEPAKSEAAAVPEAAAPVPEKKKSADEDVDEMLEHVWVEQIVAEAMGEDVSEEKQALREALAEAAQDASPAPEELPAAPVTPAAPPEPAPPLTPAAPPEPAAPLTPAALPEPAVPVTPAASPEPAVSAEPATVQAAPAPEKTADTASESVPVPAGMVLPAGDAAVDMDETPRMPVRTLRRMSDGPISLKRDTTPAVPAAAATAAAAAAVSAAVPEPAPAPAPAPAPVPEPVPAPAPAPVPVSEPAPAPAPAKEADGDVAEIVRRLSEHSQRMKQEQENAVKDYTPEEMRRLEEEDNRRRLERLRREQEEALRTRERAEEERRRLEEEEARRRREEEEDRRRREEEEARRRRDEEEDRRRREEEEDRRRREEARRQRDEEDRRRRELEEARLRREEDERKAREEYERRRREEDEAEARRREEYDRKRREEKKRDFDFDLDITAGDDFDI